MTNTTFLTLEYLGEITPISNALSNQVDLLLPFTEIGEALHIYDLLGVALKDDLLGKIEAGTLAGNDLVLVEQYIVPCAAWFSYYEASIFIIYQSTAKGIMKRQNESSVALDRQEFANLRQSILDKATFYSNKMVAYLQDNQTLFPLYRAKPCNTQQKTFGGGIFLG